jgi:transcriptional regulator GlxA family with amidase domain
MRAIGLVLLPEFSVMSFAAISAFEIANKRADATLYDIHILSETGGTIKSSIGMPVLTERVGNLNADTIIVGGGIHVHETPPGVLDYLKDAAASTRRLTSICLGAFALGDAGLLNGRRATTHWRYADELKSKFPLCNVQADRIFIADQNVWTSAGMTAGIDLALGLVENDHGRDFARTVAAGLVVNHRRRGGHPQRSVLLELDAYSDKVHMALAYAKANMREPLPLSDLAKVACLSPRQFTRVFREETGTTPAKAVDALRLEAAKMMLEQSRVSLEFIAQEVGFGSSERMRRAFVRAYGRPAQSFRRTAGPVATF